VGTFETDAANLIRHLEIVKPEGVALERILTRIGGLLELTVKKNIREKGLDDSGRLLNSIKHSVRLFSGGGEVIVGSYGVKYAHAQEYDTVIRPVFVRKLAIPVSARAKKESAAGQGPGSYGRTENHPDSTYWNPQYYRMGDVLKDADTDEVAWSLVDKVKLKGKRYMRDSLAEVTPHIIRILSQFGAEMQ
jgi:hypothetical protein